MSNPNFVIKEGVLKKCYDNGCEIIEVPDTVTEIGENAFNSFSDCRCVKEIILPNTVKKINRHAFNAGWRDHGLEKVNIPSSVEWLSTAMFENDYSIKSMPVSEGSYLVAKYPRVYTTVPLPYISDWPLPINSETYRKAFEERPDIKRIFIKHDSLWLKAVSVDEFLSLIDGVCKINKLYKCQYEWNGNLINFSGGYKFSPLSPSEIYFGNLPDSFYILFRKDCLHEDHEGWPGCSPETRRLSSNDGRKVCFDTSEDDMASYYGDNKYIELLEDYAQSHPEAINEIRGQESEKLLTFRPRS